MDKYIVGLITKQKKSPRIKTTTVNSIEEADDYALDVAVSYGVRKGYVKDRTTKKNVKFYNEEDF